MSILVDMWYGEDTDGFGKVDGHGGVSMQCDRTDTVPHVRVAFTTNRDTLALGSDRKCITYSTSCVATAPILFSPPEASLDVH
jgi:hypothetical protein